MPVNFGSAYGVSRVVKKLLIINVVVFIVTSLSMQMSNMVHFYFGLVPYLINTRFMVWQFFTYMFLHGGIGHIFFNMLVLWMFGSELENNWGSKDFLIFYLACGVGGGFLVWLTALVGYSHPMAPTIGASGAIFGLLVAYGMMWPDRLIYIWGVFPMKALHLVLLFGGMDLFQGLTKSSGNVAVFAHIGGGLTGFIYLKFGWRITVYFEGLINRMKRRKFTVTEGGASKRKTRGNEGADSGDHPDFDEEVDRILDKIAQKGMKSLNDRERKILDRASNRKRR